MNVRLRTLLAAFLPLVLSAAAQAQWTVTRLHPAGATESNAEATTATQQGGRAAVSGGFRASLWSGTAASWVNLNPTGATSSSVTAIAGSQQAGYAVFADSRAGIWSGTAASWTSLHPAGMVWSRVNATTGTQQVGIVSDGSVSRATLWTGTAASYVDLSPPGTTFAAGHGTSGTRQVGAVRIGTGGVVQASMWSGTAASWVSLHPNEASSSQANAVAGSQQVGSVTIGNVFRASLWTGTAASRVDLHPAGATRSFATSTTGVWQAGAATIAGLERASVWNGTSASWEDLSTVLPPGEWGDTTATSIWSDGSTLYVAGYGVNFAAARNLALLWKRPIGSTGRLGYNVDFNVTSGAGNGQPTFLYAGAANQTGYWNPINTPFTGTRVLRNLPNSGDGPTMTFTQVNAGPVGTFAQSNPLLGGDDALLLADGIDLGNSGSRGINIDISPMAAGLYEVTAYAIDPGSSAQTLIAIGGAFPKTGVNVGGAMPSPFALTAPRTHVTLTVPVFATPQDPAGVAGGVSVLAQQTGTGFGSLNGLQIRPASPTRLYVGTPAPGANINGLSWAGALTTPQQALAIANATPSVTEIWIKTGIHRPDASIYSANERSAAFTPRSGLSIVGGFAGTETSLAQRAAVTEATATILTGEIGAAGPNDNSSTIVDISSSGSTSTNPVILDGLMIRGADSTGILFVVNSPVEIGSSALRMRNCFVVDNLGGLTARDADVHIVNTVFRGNYEYQTCVFESTTATSGTYRFDACRFYNNQISPFLLEAVLRLRGNVTLNNCLLHDNTSQSAVVACAFGTMTLNNCTIANNASCGVVASALGSAPGSIVTVNNGILWGNRLDSVATIEDAQFLKASTSTLAIYDSIVEGWTGSSTGVISDAIIARDPRFVDPNGIDNAPGNADDNYRLGPVSPARDSGYNFTAAVPTDLGGNPRIVDDPIYANLGVSSDGVSGFVDRGCYEAQEPGARCSPADVAGPNQAVGADTLLTADDIIVFLNLYFANDARADIAGPNQSPVPDGTLSADDVIVFLNRYFLGC